MDEKQEMSAEKRALLAAICENPDDDVPRLVFADWLEEHNEPERAKFIRLQFEAEEYHEGSPERMDIEEHAVAVCEAHHRKWLADEPVWLRCPQLKFGTFPAVGLHGIRKGFIEDLRLTLDDCMARLGEIVTTAPVRELCIEQIPDGGRPLTRMPRPGCVSAAALEFSVTHPHWPAVLSSPLLRGLRSLSLRLYGRQHGVTDGLGVIWDEQDVLDDSGMIAIATCPSLSDLNSLTLGHGTVGAPGMEAIVNSPHLSGLERLSLSGHPVWDEGMIHLSRSPLAARLTELDMRYTQVGDEGLQAILAAGPSRLRRLSLGSYGRHRLTEIGLDALAQCDAIPDIRDLHLDGAPLTTGHIRSLATNPSFAGLRNLRVSLSNFDDRMAEELAASPHLRSLRFIDLQNNRVGYRGISALARSAVLDTVTTLCLYNNSGIADAGIVALASSEHVRELRRLSLVSSGLGLEGLRAVANSRHLAQLRSLDVQSARFGDEGARVLCDSPYLQRIKALTVCNCGIGDQMAASLRRRFGSAVAISQGSFED